MVTWIRLNGNLSQYDNGDHDVDFSSGISTVSPTLAQFESWNYTFGLTGNYSYYCKYHPFMTGEIRVVSS
jgi:plastocyanin